GRVWATGRSHWIPDVVEDTNFPRTPAALQNHLHAAFGFPILLLDEVMGVLEFFSREIREPDRSLIAMFHSLGSQIGQFIARKRFEERQAELLQELDSLRR